MDLEDRLRLPLVEDIEILATDLTIRVGQMCPVGTVIPRRRCYNTHRGLGCSEPVDQVVQCRHSSESTRQDSCVRSVGVFGAWDTSDDVQGRCCRRIWQPGESLRRPHLVGPEGEAGLHG